ncbi:MAG: MFS transporter, partial [Patescibacteria group bacterium]
AYLAHVHDEAVWKILLVMLFTGLTNAVDGIGRNAIIKDAVLDPRNMRMAGIVFNSIYTVGMVLGQGLAGHLVEWIGYPGSFVLNGLSFLVLIFGLSKMDFSHSKRVKAEWKGVLHIVGDNLRYVFRHPGIRTCILLAATVTLFGFAYNVILAIINKTMFNGSRQDYSYLAAVGGAGSFVGSILSILFSQRAPKTFAIGGCFIMGISQLVFSQVTNLNHGAFLMFFCGFGFMCAFLPFRGALMHIVEPHRIGIVLGITFMFFYGGMMFSSFGAGYVAKHFGCPAVLAGCGSVLLMLGCLMPFIPSVRAIE